MIIQIVDHDYKLLRTITIEEVQCKEPVLYWPCWYCGEVFVQVPDKFCKKSHSVRYCEKKIGEAAS